MTNPDELIRRLNAEIAYYDQPSHPDGHHANITERVLIQARDMILTLVKEHDASEIAHLDLGYNFITDEAWCHITHHLVV